MKKILSVLGVVILAGVFTFALSGCEKDFDWPWEDSGWEDSGEEDVDDDEDVDVDEEEDHAEKPDGSITFNDEPELADYAELFVGDKLEVMNKYYGDGYFAIDEWSTPGTYSLGVFNEGEYDGQTLYLVDLPCPGPCFGPPFYRFVVNGDGTWTAFSRYSDTWDQWYVENAGNLFDHWDNAIIDQLEYPDVLTDVETGTVFEKSDADDNSFVSELSKYKIFKDEEIGPVYIDRGSECTVAVLPDGTAQYYDMVIDFSTGQNNYDDPEIQYTGGTSGEIFDVTWDDGSEKDGYYAYKGPYFSSNCFKVKIDEYSVDMSALEQTGTTGNGDPVYTFKNSEYPDLKDAYEMAFPPYMDEGEDKLSYEEFLAKRPLFFWKDSYERLIEFSRAEFQPPAEMGKPVIYLYPEESQVVHVEVEPTNGISVSDPEYGRDGWTVLARPNGKLLNFADREVYPYLFWEGLSLDYEMTEEGFVVAHREVRSFLLEKLKVLGLNDVETADFMEFWYPKFNSAPYYFVTFMPQEDFEEIAPLSVRPEPDTVIRVYMDFVPLRRPVDVEEPVLGAPEREGFTVIEWGGALHKNY